MALLMISLTINQTDLEKFLSNGKQQDSTVVYNHFEKLLKFLKAEGVVRNGSLLLYSLQHRWLQFSIQM